MIIAFTPNAWTDFQYWQDNDQKIAERINELIRDISRDPFRGLGKPEPLRGNLSGLWSRRITGEHRLVYKVTGTKPEQTCLIISARFHY